MGLEKWRSAIETVNRARKSEKETDKQTTGHDPTTASFVIAHSTKHP